jgi:hypothetical protein
MNSVLIYLHANLTAETTITKRHRITRKTHTPTNNKQIQGGSHHFNNNNNNNNNNNTNMILNLKPLGYLSLSLFAGHGAGRQPY